MSDDDAYIIRIFDAAVTPEDTAARAAELVTLLAQGLVNRLACEKSQRAVRLDPISIREGARP